MAINTNTRNTINIRTVRRKNEDDPTLDRRNIITLMIAINKEDIPVAKTEMAITMIVKGKSTPPEETEIKDMIAVIEVTEVTGVTEGIGVAEVIGVIGDGEAKEMREVIGAIGTKDTIGVREGTEITGIEGRMTTLMRKIPTTKSVVTLRE